MSVVVVRAPGRVNLIGEHTDYTGGLALPIAINRATQIFAAVSDRVRLRSPDGDGGPDVDLALRGPHATAGWGRYVAAIIDETAPRYGIDGVVSTTIPVGAGLSSSAALELALAVALGFDGTPTELAQLGQRAEHAATGVPTGVMDQLCIASAKAGHGTLIDATTTSVTHVAIPTDVKIVVRFIAHRALEASAYAERVSECATAEAQIGPLARAQPAALRRIPDPTIRRRASHVVTENQRVRDFVAALDAHDLAAAGALITASHTSLRDDFAVSTTAMDDAVEQLLAIPGVLGARMTGGGFGGCVIAWCTPEAGVDGWVVRPVGGVHRIDP